MGKDGFHCAWALSLAHIPLMSLTRSYNYCVTWLQTASPINTLQKIVHASSCLEAASQIVTGTNFFRPSRGAVLEKEVEVFSPCDASQRHV